MIPMLYKPGTKPLYHFDPRPKFLLLVLFTSLFLIPDLRPLAPVYLFLLVILFAMGPGIRDLGSPLKMITPLLILVLLLTPPFHREGRELLNLGGFLIITDQGLIEALRLIIRFSGITFTFYLFFRTTEIDDVILTLQFFGMPYKAALVLSLTFRFIPQTGRLYQNVRDAHSLRQPEVEQSSGKWQGFRHRATALRPVLTSVLIQSIRSIPNLAMSLEMRGIGLKNRRSTLRTLSSGKKVRRDFLTGIVTGVILILPLFLL